MARGILYCQERTKIIIALFDEDRYNELTDILDQLYPLAYPSQSTTELDAWSFE